MTFHLRLLSAAALALCMAGAVAAPDPVVLRPDMPLPAAKRLLDAAMESCHARGKTLAAAVVDRGGNLVALQRDDGVGPHNTVAAQRKAYTALSTKTATRELADKASSDPQAHNLATIGELLLLGGGVPVKAGTDVIGAIGIAGAGGGAGDEACALDAVARVFPGGAPALPQP